MMTDRPLRTWEACYLAEIMEAAIGKKPVARLIDGEVFRGEARNIGGRQGNPSTASDDVRDLFLRVTSGQVDHFWLVAELMAELPDGVFVTNYQS